MNLILWKEKCILGENWLIFFGVMGEAELILRFGEQRKNTFRELRHSGRSVHNFQGSREHRPPGGLNTI